MLYCKYSKHITMPKTRKWNLENIRSGFERFEKENGRLPSSIEIDQTLYLPSARQVTRLFGGLPQLRTIIGYTDIHFGKGENRSSIGHRSYELAIISEANLGQKLCTYFHEVFVHIERPVRGSKVRLDFYVYNQTKNFGVDIFNTENIPNLRSNLTAKSRKYSGFKELLYFVVQSEGVTENDILNHNLGKAGQLLPNMKLISLNSFLEEIKKFIPHNNPL